MRTLVVLLVVMAVWTGPAAAQSPTPGSAGREGDTLVIRSDSNSGNKKVYIANGFFYPTDVFLGTRRIDYTDPAGYPTYAYEPAYGPGCEPASGDPDEFGSVRCPLAGVSEVLVDMGGRDLTDVLMVLASGAAPPVRVRGGTLDAMPASYWTREPRASAPPALTTLAYETTRAGNGSALFLPGQLERFEAKTGSGVNEIQSVGAADVSIETGGGDDVATVENASGTVAVETGGGDDVAYVATRPGSRSSIDGGAGDDALRSPDRHRTTITCGAGDDQISGTTADRAGAGCAPLIRGLEPFSGFTTCAADLRCRFKLGRRAATGTVRGGAVTVRGVGRLAKPAVVWGRIAVKTRLYGGEAHALTRGARRPAGKLSLTLKLAKGRSAQSLRHKGLRMLIGTRTRSGDTSSVIAETDGIAFRAR